MKNNQPRHAADSTTQSAMVFIARAIKTASHAKQRRKQKRGSGLSLSSAIDKDVQHDRMQKEANKTREKTRIMHPDTDLEYSWQRRAQVINSLPSDHEASREKEKGKLHNQLVEESAAWHANHTDYLSKLADQLQEAVHTETLYKRQAGGNKTQAVLEATQRVSATRRLIQRTKDKQVDYLPGNAVVAQCEEQRAEIQAVCSGALSQHLRMQTAECDRVMDDLLGGKPLFNDFYARQEGTTTTEDMFTDTASTPILFKTCRRVVIAPHERPHTNRKDYLQSLMTKNELKNHLEDMQPIRLHASADGTLTGGSTTDSRLSEPAQWTAAHVYARLYSDGLLEAWDNERLLMREWPDGTRNFYHEEHGCCVCTRFPDNVVLRFDAEAFDESGKRPVTDLMTADGSVWKSDGTGALVPLMTVDGTLQQLSFSMPIIA